MDATEQKQEIIKNLNIMPQNKLNEVNMFIRFIIYEANQNTQNEEYSNLDFISSEQNAELKSRLQNIENNKTDFISLENFKKKNDNYL